MTKRPAENLIRRNFLKVIMGGILCGRVKVVFQTFNWVKEIVSRGTSLFEI